MPNTQEIEKTNDLMTLLTETEREVKESLRAKIRQLLYANRICNVEHVTEDIYQQTMVKAISRLYQLRSVGKMRGWLFTIARNAVIEHLRNNAKRRDKDGLIQIGDWSSEVSLVEDESCVEPLDLLVAKEDGERLWQLVEGMSPRLRQFFHLYAEHGNDREAIREAMGWKNQDLYYRYSELLRNYLIDHLPYMKSCHVLRDMIALALAFQRNRDDELPSDEGLDVPTLLVDCRCDHDDIPWNEKMVAGIAGIMSGGYSESGSVKLSRFEKIHFVMVLTMMPVALIALLLSCFDRRIAVLIAYPHMAYMGFICITVVCTCVYMVVREKIRQWRDCR